MTYGSTPADQADLASDHEEMFRGIALRARKPEGPQANGKCLCCDQTLRAGMRWCDADCRDEWQKEQRK